MTWIYGILSYENLILSPGKTFVKHIPCKIFSFLVWPLGTWIYYNLKQKTFMIVILGYVWQNKNRIISVFGTVEASSGGYGLYYSAY